jgi:hypothetical protein
MDIKLGNNAENTVLKQYEKVGGKHIEDLDFFLVNFSLFLLVPIYCMYYDPEIYSITRPEIFNLIKKKDHYNLKVIYNTMIKYTGIRVNEFETFLTNSNHQ